MVRWAVVCLAVAVTATAPGNVSAQPVDGDSPYRIALRNVAPFVPEAGVRVELPRRDANPRDVHVLVQLDVVEVERARATAESQTQLRRLFGAQPDNAPLRLQGNLQNTTYEAVISRAIADRLISERSLAAFDDGTERLVRWVGSLPLEAKLESALLDRRYERWALGPNGTIRLLVTFHEDALDEAEAILDELAVEHGPYTGDTWWVLLPIDRLDELIAEDSVRSVAQGPKPFSALNDLARTAVGGDIVQKADLTSDPPTYQGLTGEDIVVAVMDVGVDADHDDFWDHDLAGDRTVSRVDHQTVGQPISLHGTHVAGIIAGSGYQSTRANGGGVGNGGTTSQWRGMAPEATIVSFANVNSGGNVAVQYQATVEAGADVSNESHEQEKCLVYDQIAETVDSLVRGTEVWMGETIPRRPAVWGAGNNGQAGSGCQNYGYFGVTVASKNPIVVGATNTNGGLLWEHSSPGPTYDGRLKPDLVAPGCTAGAAAVGLTSTAMTDPDFPQARSNGYDRNCGTSMSTAVVTGIVALLLEKWRQQLIVTDDCGVASGSECFPLPSTLKALLVQGAMDLIDVLPYANPDTGAPLQYHAGPDYATGYGLVRADASVAIIDAGIVGINRRVVEAEAFAIGPPDEYLVVVPSNAQRLRVTLAWDDPPGSHLLADTEPQLKNDLDLELVSPSAATLLPWIVPALKPNVDATGEHNPDLPDPIVASNVLAATTGVDARNNVEQVEVTAPSEGTWVVRVKGGKLPVGDSQEYSLASDYAFGSILAKPSVPSPPTNLCVELDWIRAPSGLRFDFANSTPCAFIPLEPICRYVVNCPICQRLGVCPEIRLALTDVPDFFRVAIRRADGSTAATDESRARTRTLRWTTVAGEKYGLFFEPAPGATPAGPYQIGVDLRGRERDRNASP